MTTAVCVSCGALKTGAFTICPECGFTPTSEDDLVKSMYLNDHFWPLDALKEVGRGIKDGAPIDIKIDPAERQEMVDALHEEGMLPPPKTKSTALRLTCKSVRK